jgi:hypothetical protein
LIDFNVIKNFNLKMDLRPKGKIGILVKGKNSVIVDNTFKNLDIGIQDEGENTVALGNKFD